MFVDETKKEYEKILKINDEKLREESLEKFNQEIEKGRVYWKKAKDDLDHLINERSEFVTTETFYPRNYASIITSMEVFSESASEYAKKNPLVRSEKIEKVLLEEPGKVSEFKDAKRKVEEMLPLITEHEKTIKNKKILIDFILKRQDMLLGLQRGDIKEVRSLLRYFRGKTKNIKK